MLLEESSSRLITLESQIFSVQNSIKPTSYKQPWSLVPITQNNRYMVPILPPLQYNSKKIMPLKELKVSNYIPNQSPA